MISTSSSLPRVLKSICDYDESIKYDPNLFVGFIKDLYCGGKNILDDFIVVVYGLKYRIEQHNLSIEDLSTIRLIGSNGMDRCGVQAELLKSLYINNRPFNVSELDRLISNVYEGVVVSKKNVYDEASSSSILYFKPSSNGSIEYGKIITLSWDCNNPYRLSLFNGCEYMDVTQIKSILVSAMFDSYVLLLHDKEGKTVEEKRIEINFRNNAFCMNCGTLSLCEDDVFCTNCGFKL